MAVLHSKGSLSVTFTRSGVLTEELELLVELEALLFSTAGFC